MNSAAGLQALLTNYKTLTDMRKTILCLLVAFTLAPAAFMSAQVYENAPVTISKEKIRSNGVLYYSHVVQEKQTLFSISKAYSVSIQEIYDSNPKLNLQTEGLKKNQIILIPVKDIAKQPEAAAQQEATARPQAQETANTVSATPAPQGGYIEYIAKWYDDLNTISQKFGVSKETLMAVNGMKDERVKKKQKFLIPSKDIPAVKAPQAEDAAEIVNPEVSAVSTDKDSTYVESNLTYVPVSTINVSLILPLNAQGAVNNSNYDFYSGALLAVKALGAEGINTNLNVFDMTSKTPVTEATLAESNVIIGPISSGDITATLEKCHSGQYLVSPLDPRATSLTEKYANVIQAPSSTDSQFKDIISWISEDWENGDRLILVTEKNATPTALAQLVSESGIEYQTLTYGILEGRNVTSSLSGMMSQTATNRVVIASDSEAFVNDVVRNLNLMVFRKYDVALYGPSRMRNFETIEVEHFHNTKLHLSTSYYVDYESSKLKSFLLSYRALFGAEPTPFAYQGYDTAYFFISQCAREGQFWAERLSSDRSHGLQSDFRMVKMESGSYVNTAVRRVLYGPEYEMKLLAQ